MSEPKHAMHAECTACGFTEAESAQMAALPSGVLQKILALAKSLGVAAMPAIRAALPFLIVGDYMGAIEAILKLLVPQPA